MKPIKTPHSGLSHWLGLVFVILLGMVTVIGSGGGGGGDGVVSDDQGTNGGFVVGGRILNLVNGLVVGSATEIPSGVMVQADYVYAVNTVRDQYGILQKIKEPIQLDGGFTITLTKGGAWILAFIDTAQTGSSMIQGIFSAQQLDTISPDEDADGATTLGDMSVDENGVVELPVSLYETYVGNLGITLAQASTLGSLDDLALRYINPDLDGNGVMDMDEANFPGLDMRVGQTYRFGDDSTIEFIRSGAGLPTDTAIYPLVVNNAFAGIGLWIVNSDWDIFSSCPAKWSLEWIDTDGNNNTTVPNPYTVTDCVWYEGNDKTLGVGFPLGVTSVPDGTYIYRFYANADDVDPQKTLTFTNIKTLEDASDFTNLVVPFPTFNVNDDGDITSVDYTWMKNTGTEFVVATPDDVRLIIGGVEMGWRCADVSCGGWYNGFDLTSSTGSFAITDEDVDTGGNLSQKRSNIDVVGFFFYTKLGNKYMVRICSSGTECAQI